MAVVRRQNWQGWNQLQELSSLAAPPTGSEAAVCSLVHAGHQVFLHFQNAAQAEMPRRLRGNISCCCFMSEHSGFFLFKV